MKEGYARIEIFPNETEALERIETLTAEGKKEGDIHAIYEERKGSSKIADWSSVHYHNASGSIKDKLSSFFSKQSEEEPEDKVLKKFDLNDQERNELEDELIKGKVLLYYKSDEYGPKFVRSEELTDKKDGHNQVREDVRALETDREGHDPRYPEEKDKFTGTEESHYRSKNHLK